MVLLDDSNTYWWLVRIVKDGSIGASHHDLVKREVTHIAQDIFQRSISKHPQKDWQG